MPGAAETTTSLIFLPHFLRLHQLRTIPLQTRNARLEARRVIKYWPRDAAYIYQLRGTTKVMITTQVREDVGLDG
jgi:hypothetical protein